LGSSIIIRKTTPKFGFVILDVIPTQPLNELLPILVTLLGSVIAVILVIFKNKLLGIDNVLSNVTLSIPSKELVPILVTLSVIVNDVKNGQMKYYRKGEGSTTIDNGCPCQPDTTGCNSL
jgi:hypothetical protein